MTEYLVVTLAFVALCGCAIVAYTGLDAIERDEEEGPSWAKQQRAPRPDAMPAVPVRLTQPQQRWHGGSASAHADWLEERVRGLEERFDQLVRDSQRVPSS